MTTLHWMNRHPHHDAQPWAYQTTDLTAINPTAAENPAPDPEQPPGTEGHPSHGGPGLMMLVGCIPMILLAVALVATGVAGSGAIVGALLCTAMMAVIMLAMPGGHGHK